MKLIVVDGQGGGMGKAIVTQMRKAFPESEILAVGTNSIATSAMMKAGATAGATGENAVVCNCANAATGRTIFWARREFAWWMP